MSGKHAKAKESNNAIKVAAATAVVIGATTAPLIGATAASARTLSGPWACVVQYESGNRNLSYGDATSTGYLQIQTPTWLDYGGAKYAPEAYQATEAQQFAVAMKILAGQGPGAWTTNATYGCGLTRSTPNPFSGVGTTTVAKPKPVAVDPPDAPAPAVKPTPAQKPAATYTVVKGDWLMKIARKHYGSAAEWTKIYNANKAVIGGNPDLILPGQVLTLP